MATSLKAKTIAAVSETIAQRIQCFKEKHTEGPNQPALWIKNSKQQLIPVTAKAAALYQPGATSYYNRKWVSSHKLAYGLSIIYDEDLKLMEIAWIEIDAHVPKKNELKTWKYTSDPKFYIDTVTHLAFYANGAYADKEKSIWPRKAVSGYHSRVRFCAAVTDAYLYDEEVLKDLNDKLKVVDDIGKRWSFWEFWSKNLLPVSDMPKKKKGVDYRSLNILNVNMPIEAYYPPIEPGSYRSYRYGKDLAYYQKVEDLEVFTIYRPLRYMYDDVKISDEPEEIARPVAHIFFDGKHKTTKTFLIDRRENTWTPSSLCKSNYQSNNATIYNFQDVIDGGEYRGWLNDLETKDVYNVIRALQNPQIEQAYNMGCKNISTLMIRNLEGLDRKYKDMFYKTYRKSETISKNIGLTSKQLKILDGTITFENDRYSSYTRYTMLWVLRHIVDNLDLSSIQPDQFSKLLAACKGIELEGWRERRVGAVGNMIHSQTNQLVALQRFAKICNTDEMAQVYKDAYHMWEYLDRNMRPEIDWLQISSPEVLRLHDELVELRRLESERRRAQWDKEAAERAKKQEEQYAKNRKAREHYEAHNDKYTIILPVHGADIVREGSSLSHCVGGYVDKHISCATTILFLRRIENPDSSWYTIEVNDGRLIQIHGRHNCWLGASSEAEDVIPFVYQWLQDQGIRFDEHILLCTAGGYGSNGVYLDKSYLIK